MMAKAPGIFGILVVLGVTSTTAWAQTGTTGAIAGTARDTTGAVLPGVTVEASSPALIEKVRTAVTDDQGNYKIVDLRPGTYKVIFTLSGFSTFQREGIELTAGFTAAANAEMKVGSLSETVTVTGASPVVDVQNVRTQNVLSRDVLDSVPNNKTLPAFAALTLGATVGAGNQDVGGNKGEPPIGLSIHGSRFNDSKLLFDGMTYNSLHAEGGGQMRIFLLNQTAVQETVLGTGGIIAESDTGGVQINNVPREGSNKFSLYGNFAFANESMQGTNLSPQVQARGLTGVNPVRRIYDYGVGIGGPIVRDRLWFYSANRWWNSGSYILGLYYNKSTTNFQYVPDTTQRAYQDNPARDNAFRLTWQAAATHKVTLSDNIQVSCQCFQGISALTSPEATASLRYGPSHLIQSTWSHPQTNRLLMEGGASFGFFETSPEPAVSTVKDTDIRITELTTGFSWGAYATALNNGTAYGKGQWSNPFQQRFAVSYITGSHAFKTGMQSLYGDHRFNGHVNQSVQYTVSNGLPISITQWASPLAGEVKVKSLALYAQDQWTIRRFTLSGGLRYDNFVGWAPAQTRPAGIFVQAYSFGEVNNVPNYKDLTPRGGVAYDLFGNGKTAIKASFGRYLVSMGSGIAVANLPSVAFGQSASRTWTDANHNFIPDCDLTNFAANGECGVLSSATFGKPVVTTTFAPDAITGWNTRQHNTQMSVGLQQELFPNVGLNVGYFRTAWGNLPVQQNLATAASDYTTFCVTAPSDARLPNGGGYQVCGLYDVNPNKIGQVNNLVTQSSNFGSFTQVFNGLDAGVNARFGKGGFLSAGVSTGRTVTDACFANNRPDIVPGAFGGGAVETATVFTSAAGPRIAGFCNIRPPWSANTQVKANAIYPMPLGLQTSFTYQNLPGVADGATLNYTNAQVAPALGRNLSAGVAGTVAVPLIMPQTVFEDRLNQFDLRFTKIVRVGRSKLQGMFDIYNLFNASTILGVNSTYGTAAWLRPTAILGARLFKVGGQIDW
jgi:hypothetical protein